MRIIRPRAITDTILTASSVPENDYPAYSAATTYASGNRRIVAATHQIYESLQGSNLNHYPPDSPTYWLCLGYSNRWRMFDGAVGTATSSATDIVVDLRPGIISAIAFLGIEALSILLELNDPTAGEVYSRAISMSSEGMVVDWYSYFFQPIANTADVVVTDLPSYPAATLTITIAPLPTAAASCGMCVVGPLFSVGDLQWAPQVSIIDYSRKETDTFGITSLAVRDFVKRMECDLLVDTKNVDLCYRVLAGYRATPLVWIGSELYGCMIIYGFYRRFTIVIAGPTVSACALEIEGLISPN